jgi:hypothetical protein
LESRLRAAFSGQPPQLIKETVLKLVDANSRGCALILDYPPSYNYDSRWGFSCPPHAGLTALLDRDGDVHREILQQLVALKPCFDRIAIQFEHEKPGEAGGWGADQ